jgi:hypothetical protein
MYFTDAIQSARDSVFDPPVVTATALPRWKRRYDRKEDVD